MSSLLDCDCPQYGTAELILILELQLLITAESKRTGSFDCCICKGDSPSLLLIVQLFVLTVSLLCLCSPLWAASWKLQASASLIAVLIAVWKVLSGRMEGRINGCLAGLPLNLGVIFGSYIYLRGQLLTLCKNN